ncbi:MAG: alpha/beta fold hydrolase [Defluviitaleaceae bacterium]|nr:alpha/beta fold hydrolase [Defluviitaleaceae bacterium]
MKRRTKVLLAIGAAIAAPVIINHAITKKAQARLPKRECESLYNWEYGDIRYITAGDGPPLLLLHGIYPGAGALEFKNVVKKFADNYKVYVPDLLGFGYSDKPNVSYCAYLYVRLIKDFAEDVIGTPVVAAASLHTAAALAICAKLNPEDFTKIILISPTGTSEDVDLATDVEGYAKKALESPIFGTSFYHALTSKKGLPQFLEYEGISSTIDNETLDELYLSAHAGGAGGKYPIAALLAKFFNGDINATLDALTVPYHIITGDTQPASEHFALWSEPGEETPVSIVENARLLPHLDNPEAFHTLCKELLG